VCINLVRGILLFHKQNSFLSLLKFLQTIANQISTSNIPTKILGDFNIDALKYGISDQVSEYIDLLFSFDFLQLVTKPTGCTHNSATLIDHVLSKSVCVNADSFILTSLISDHFPIVHHCNSQKMSIKPKTIQSRDFSDGNLTRFKEALQNMDWSVVTESNDAQDSFNYFMYRRVALCNLQIWVDF